MLSARNRIKGKVLEVKDGAVNAIVKVDAGNGITITSVITKESAHELGLSANKDCFAVLKASEVMIANEKVNISARNQIEGIITAVENGICNCVVKIDAAGGVKVTSVITNESANELNLAVGNKTVAIVKSSSVMISVK